MDELLKSMQLPESLTPVVTIWSVLIGIGLAALLSACVGLVYRRVHSESGYSQYLVHTLVIISMITALIMAIIGSNIARAFSLVGALSIIRFRSAIKSPLDVTFIFLAISVGMACGTHFYAIAIVATLAISAVILLMHTFNFGSASLAKEFILTIHFHPDVDYESALKPLLGKFFEAFSLTFTQTLRQGTLREVTYSVRPKEGVSDRDVVNELRKVNDNLKIAYKTIHHAVEIP